MNNFVKEFLSLSDKKPIRIISHYDCDGITSAAIIAKALKRLDKKFSIKIVKSLDKEILLPELKKSNKEILFFTDLGSGSLEYFSEIERPIFILDHHEIDKTKIGENVKIINPHLFNQEEICGAGLCYLFAKSLSKDNSDLANLAVIGMIGDRLEEISRLNQTIIQDAKELMIKKGPMIFSATRPLRKSLEYSTSTYIPGVTGSSLGVNELLKDIGVSPERTLYDLNQEEMSKLITSIMIRRAKNRDKDDIIGNIYLLKFFNRIEDVRELSVLINACSRLGHSDIALSFCMENEKAKTIAEEIYVKYRQELMSALKVVEGMKKLEGNGFVIINAKNEIQDTIIGTVTSILSSSANYEEGTILIGMAYTQDKIKVSARIVGDGRNLKEVMEKTTGEFEADVGGHKNAAGCLIKREDESKFLEALKKNLEIEVFKL